MDEHRFDDWTRTLAYGISRRRVLAGLTGSITAAGLALISRDNADAFICRGAGVLCTKDAQCCSGNCNDRMHQCNGWVEVCRFDSTCDGTYYFCGHPEYQEDCACAGTVDGGFTCITTATSCTEECSSTAECEDNYGPGWACVTGGCCDQAYICVPTCGVEYTRTDLEQSASVRQRVA